MGTMIKYEFKKIFRSRWNILITILLLFLVSRATWKHTTTYPTMNEKGKEITGKEAVSYLKNQYEIDYPEGILTDEVIQRDLIRLKKELNFKDSNVDREVAFQKLFKNPYFISRRNYFWGLADGFDSLEEPISDIFSLLEKQESLPSFYTIQEQKMANKIETLPYSDAKKNYLMSFIKEVKTPFEIGYSEGWWVLKMTMDSSIKYLLLLSGLLVCGIFSEERTSGMDSLLLSSKKGRKELFHSKVQTAFFIGVVIAVLSFLLIILPQLIFFGVDGWDLPLQLESTSEFLPWSISKLRIVEYGLRILHIFVLIAFATMLSSIFKRKEWVILVYGLFFFFSNFFITFRGEFPNLQRWINNQGSFLFFLPYLSSCFKSSTMEIYSILGHPVTFYTLAYFIQIIFIVSCFWVTYGKIKRWEVD
ncbi:ABC transporter permease subunit [Tissierella pigra]|uniref:ABC transporter permease subunit n=1 Tax=Tissierella pigra TaxID=2607614 RepID=A0A6N7XQ31_9FIRM|nr:ABC transporter permease subunit [Tissierella pigra]MBU5427748.1 ABC transporter permease subunit [Tissierella pigra]MSU03576.1 ABC transporter permease subunit [Tissierella pigra]